MGFKVLVEINFKKNLHLSKLFYFSEQKKTEKNLNEFVKYFC